jgi:DNA-directed RNA polymerase subunit M/transcription elongation factor TFIIS
MKVYHISRLKMFSKLEREEIHNLILSSITPLIKTDQNDRLLKWCTKAVSQLELCPNLKVAKFQWDVIFHYFQPSDIENLIVSTQRDIDLVKKMFIESCDLPENYTLQEPEETFQEVVVSDTCIKCKSTDTITFARQTRSADEPTSYYSECLTCKHKWRSG